jgi:hypothetical protein
MSAEGNGQPMPPKDIPKATGLDHSFFTHESLTLLILQLNRLLDCGKYDNISLDEIETH